MWIEPVAPARTVAGVLYCRIQDWRIYRSSADVVAGRGA